MQTTVRRTAVLARPGPDATADDLRAAAADFTPLPLGVGAGVPTLLDGKLGRLERVWVGGDGTLYGALDLPADLERELGPEKRGLRVAFDRTLKRITGVTMSTTHNALANFSANDSGSLYRPGYAGSPCMPQGRELLMRVYKNVRLSSQAAAGLDHVGKPYLDKLQKLLDKLVEAGAIPDGDSDLSDRVSYSAGMDPQRRARLLGCTDLGRKRLGETASFNGTVADFVKFAADADLDPDNLDPVSVANAMQGDVLFDWCYQQIKAARTEAEQDQSGFYGAKYLKALDGILDLLKKLGAEEPDEPDQPAADAGFNVNFAGKSRSLAKKKPAKPGKAPLASTDQADADTARADSGQTQRWQEQGGVTDAEQKGEADQPMSPERKRALLGMTAYGQSVLTERARKDG